MEIKANADEINNSYEKWIISFQIGRVYYYAVWGTDSADDGDDKFWIDDKQRILAFKDPKHLIDVLLESSASTFDSNNIAKWASEIKEHACYAVDALYDLNVISNQINRLDFERLADINPTAANSLVSFINLFGDYATQVDDAPLISVWDNSSLKIFWEYMYNAHFWTIPADELKLRQDELTKGYDGEECRESLNEMIRLFKSKLFVKT